ncbi:MAG: Uma2 family endonuclease [Sandaracinaceae bacterium]|nr:Uma2 family endonuclease [Sandaracinaceae bacterium]
MPDAAARAATLEDFLSMPEERRFHELLGGAIVEKATPSGEHGDAQAGVVGAVRPPYQRPPGRGGPGGWWIATEVEVLLPAGEVVRPDVVGWRRERAPERPTGAPVRITPDWVCEVLSPSNANVDTVKKLRLYHGAAVPHYCIVDPRDATLTVMRWSEPGYLMVLRAERGETVRPEPFDAIELAVGTLFGEDPP